MQPGIDRVEDAVGAIDGDHEDLISPFDSDRFEPGSFEVHLRTISP
jgi:hypothetical protein